jgi:predicted cobalt transporter CbtA
MKTLAFIVVSLLSGAIAGTLLGLVNQIIVEPFIDRAIGIETQKNIASSRVDLNEQSHYRMWQKIGEIVAGTIFGTSLGALVGIVFAYTRNRLPGSSNQKKAVIITGVMFFVLFLIPALKYPPNPPAVGNPSTIYYREILYIGILAISGLSSLVLAMSYRRISGFRSKNIIMPLLYAIIVSAAYLMLPSNPDKITIPNDLMTSFRVASVTTMAMFWLLLGVIFGSLYDMIKPHETSKLVSHLSD